MIELRLFRSASSALATLIVVTALSGAAMAQSAKPKQRCEDTGQQAASNLRSAPSEGQPATLLGEQDLSLLGTQYHSLQVTVLN